MEIIKKQGTIILEDADYEMIKSFNISIYPGYNTKYARIGTTIGRFIMGLPLDDKKVVDHINGDRYDNRKCNLNIVTRFENGQNVRRGRIARSGYPGIKVQNYSPGKYRFQAFIGANGKHYVLGSFGTIEEAISARKKAEEKLHYRPFIKDYLLPTAIINTSHGKVIVDEEDLDRLSYFTVIVKPNKIQGKVSINLSTGLHRYLMNLKHGERLAVDHINGNGLDNRRLNLRVGTFSDNMHNYHLLAVQNKTGFRGVGEVPNKRANGKINMYYSAKIRVNGKTIYLGKFKTPEEAHLAYQQGAIKYHKNFVNTDAWKDI
jgi:phage tail tube protein FII